MAGIWASISKVGDFNPVCGVKTCVTRRIGDSKLLMIMYYISSWKMDVFIAAE